MTDFTQFASALLDPDAQAPSQIASINQQFADERFSIYRNNLMASLCGALADTFPVVVQLVGLEFFNATARAFIRQQPKRSPLLTWVGADFAEFIAVFEHTATMPWLTHVARIEFARLKAYHAANTIEMNVDALTALVSNPIDLMNTGVFLRADVTVLTSPFAAYSVWAAHQDEGDLTKINIGSAESCLVYRNQLDVECVKIGSDQAIFINALANGKTFSEAQIQASLSNSEFQLSQSFLLLIQARALSGLRQ